MSKNKHNHNVGSKIIRSDDRIRETGEVFTPEHICDQMVDNIPEYILRNPQSKFIDNSAGCGNFLVALLNKLTQYHSRDHVVNHMIYAVELMEDNHREVCERMGVPIDHEHYINANALEYNNLFGEDGTLEGSPLGGLM